MPRKRKIGGRGQKRKVEERGQIASAEASVVTQQKNKPGEASSATAGESSGASPAARLPRYPPFPKGGTADDVRKWDKECSRISGIIEKATDYDITTMIGPKDSYTTKAVQSSRDKMVVRRAARSIVSVSYIMDDGRRLPRCTGIIIKQLSDDPGQHRAIIVTYSRVVCKEGRKLDPLPKLSVTLPDKKTVLDAELIYFNDHYDIALLCVRLDYPLELPSIRCGPEYGQEVFVLARDREVSLRVRCGHIKWLEESDILGRDYYTFLSCDIPEGGNGGMVIDHDGGVRGMAVYWSPYPAVISVSITEKCVDMFMHFNRVARPVLGICFRTIAMLDVQCQEDISDFGINAGFLVDEVYNPVAEDLGIKCGNVIISINGQGALTLPELEDYLLSLGLDYLKDELIFMKDAKLRVFDLKSGVERDVTLPVRFYDKAERARHTKEAFCLGGERQCKSALPLSSNAFEQQRRGGDRGRNHGGRRRRGQCPGPPRHRHPNVVLQQPCLESTTDEVCAARLLPRLGPCLDLCVETASGCGSGGGAEAGWPARAVVVAASVSQRPPPPIEAPPPLIELRRHRIELRRRDLVLPSISSPAGADGLAGAHLAPPSSSPRATLGAAPASGRRTSTSTTSAAASSLPRRPPHLPATASSRRRGAHQ